MRSIALPIRNMMSAGRWPRTQTRLAALVICSAAPSDDGVLHSQAARTRYVDSAPVIVLPPEGTEPFGRVAGAVRLSSGTIMVADESHHTVRSFDIRGAQFAQVGRRGGGPDEFLLLSSIQACGADSAYAFDPQQGRVTVLDARGKVARVFSLLAGGNTLAYDMRCNGTSSLIVLGWPRFRHDIPPGPYREKMKIYRADLSGRDLGPVGEFFADERYRFVKGDGPRIFGKLLIVAASGDRIYVGEGDRYQIAVMGLGGTAIGNVSMSGEPVQVTRAHIDRFVSDHLAMVRNPGNREAQRRGFKEYQFPARFPPYSGILIDPEGKVWVRGYRPPTESSERWTVFSANGQLEEEIDIPASLEVLQIGDGFVLGRHTDSEGAHEVRVHRMLRR